VERFKGMRGIELVVKKLDVARPLRPGVAPVELMK
jgi:hypothetical protein